MIQSMVFWWFPSVFSKNHPQTGFPKSSKNHRLNHQKIIDFWIFQSFCNMFNENQGTIPKSMIFWWFPSVFSKNHPQTGSPNHQKIIDWIIKKSSGISTIPRNATQNHQKNIIIHHVPEKLPGIILEIIIFSTCPRKATQNHPRNHPVL